MAKCRNLQTGEAVAVKVLKKQPGFLQDAENEVDSQTSFNSYNTFEEVYLCSYCFKANRASEIVYEFLQPNFCEIKRKYIHPNPK